MIVPEIQKKTVMKTIEDGAAFSSAKNPRMMWLLLDSIRRQPEPCKMSEAWKDLRRGTEVDEEELRWFEENPKMTKTLVNVARNNLIHYGLMEIVGRKRGAKWRATQLGAIMSDEAELHFFTRDEPEEDVELETWQEQVVDKLLDLSPEVFEHFVGKLLCKAGVFNVEVTGRSNDGGIDGHGSTVNGPLSMPVFFQAKRYRGSVSSSVVRDFRGAVQGRGHLGMIFTTGTFTKDAIAEATRTQSVNIQLFDGAKLAEWLKDLRIGISVKTRTVEDVSLVEDWWCELEANMKGGSL